jgi:hypothetical protein
MRIRIRIRIQHFFKLRIRIPDPDPGSGSRLWWPKNGKNLQLEILFWFFWSKIAFYLSLDLNKGPPKLQVKPSALKREHPALQNMKILDFFLFFGVFFALLDPDPDPQFECGSGSSNSN